ncbi:MAG: glycosyltransferase [Pseudonocardia sp.]
MENSLRDNGGLRVSLEYARQWTTAGIPTTVAVLQDVDDGPLIRPDPALCIDLLTPRGSRLRYTWQLALVRLTCLARHADVVVSGSEVGFGLLLGYAAARMAGRPFAILVQGDLAAAIDEWVPRPLHRLTRWVHTRSDAAVCVSESLLAGVVANGLPRSKAHIVLNGIDVARVRRLAGLDPVSAAVQNDTVHRARPSGEPRDGILTVVSAGRLCLQKDFSLLVQAHAQVRAGGVEHRLIILGEGLSRAELELLVAELGVQDSVELPGHVDNPYLLMSTADLYVTSSRQEGMPLSVLEALAVGAPILATRCGTGMESLLVNGAYGELVPVGLVDPMASAIEEHLRDPQVLRMKALHGPRRALEFDVAESARAILAVLRGLTS